jgi:Flp pilus assembly protein TadD
MASSSHLDALIRRVEAHAPAFGRATPDLEAISSRARAADYRGVLQNTRLVVETLLRAILAKKGHTPGKQTLEQLVSKMQADLPTAVAVHVRTIQAWGNVGAHDHGDDLFAGGLTVTDQEASSALTALVAILDWYRGAHLQDAPAAPAAPRRGRGLALGLVAAGALAAGVALVLLRPTPAPPEVPRPTPAAPDLGPLDALYAARGLPTPNESCRPHDPELGAALAAVGPLLMGGEAGARRPQDAQARARLEAVPEAQRTLGEYWLLVALARSFDGAPDAEVLAALSQGQQHCDELPELYNMQGKLLFKAGDVPGAIQAFKRAAAVGEGYGAPRLNLGLAYLEARDLPRAQATFDELISSLSDYAPGYRGRGALHLGQGRAAEAVADLKQAILRDPGDGLAHRLLGQALTLSGDPEGARAALCAAKGLGQAVPEVQCP